MGQYLEPGEVMARIQAGEACSHLVGFRSKAL